MTTTPLPNFVAPWASRLGGIQVEVSRYACCPEFVRWRKTHRRARIRKKWRKRYGAVIRCPGKCYQLGDVVLMCPCAWAALEKSQILRSPL